MFHGGVGEWGTSHAYRELTCDDCKETTVGPLPQIAYSDLSRKRGLDKVNEWNRNLGCQQREKNMRE